MVHSLFVLSKSPSVGSEDEDKPHSISKVLHPLSFLKEQGRPWYVVPYPL